MRGWDLESSSAYLLDNIKALLRRRWFRITASAAASARATLGFDESDILGCLLCLTDDDFFKTLPPEYPGGPLADVYKARCQGTLCYIKLLCTKTFAGETVVIISFRHAYA